MGPHSWFCRSQRKNKIFLLYRQVERRRPPPTSLLEGKLPLSLQVSPIIDLGPPMLLNPPLCALCEKCLGGLMNALSLSLPLSQPLTSITRSPTILPFQITLMISLTLLVLFLLLTNPRGSISTSFCRSCSQWRKGHGRQSYAQMGSPLQTQT